MKDKTAEIIASRQRLLQQIPDASLLLPGSLLSRMVRCNKPGCRFCVKAEGKGHGPICILSASLGQQRVRQIPIPSELKSQVEKGLLAYAKTQKLLKQIALLNLELLREQKRRQRK